MARCEHGWGGDDDCPDCLSVLETRAEKAEARVKELEGENAAIKDMHARILSWPPEDVERAYTALLQLAATEAHAGGDGKKARDAVDALRRHESQVEAERDALRARVKELEKARDKWQAETNRRANTENALRAKLKELEADVEHLTHANGLMAPELVRLRARNKELREATTKGGE